MSEGHGLALTQAQLVSSLLGYCGLGVAIACFIPLILGNAARRRSGTGGWFLAIWLVADIVNLAGIIRLGAPLTQIFLAAWYFIADIIMGIELLFWGHPGGLAPAPTPAKTMLKKREQEATSELILHFDEQFADWSLWDNAKTVIGCIFIGMAWWGIYLVVMIYRTQGEFEIEIPMSHTIEALLLGGLGTALFTIARTPEMLEGRKRNQKKEPPTQELSDGVFVFLIIENVFNLVSICVLMADPSLAGEGLRKQYFLGELPWILGAIVPICFDVALVIMIARWQRKWKSRKDTAKQQHDDEKTRLEDDIKRVQVALLHLKERKEEFDLKAAAVDHLAAVQAKNEKRKTKGKWTDPMREKIGRPKKERRSSLHDDYQDHFEKMQPDYQHSRSRKNHDKLAETHGPLNLRTDSAYGSDSEKSVDSEGDNVTVPLTSHQSSSIRSDTERNDINNAGSRRNSRSGPQ